MNSTVDPFDLLVRLRPDADVAALRPGEDPRMDALLERSLAETGRARPFSGSRRRKRRMFLGGLIVAVTGTAGTLTWALNRSERPADPRFISCHRTAVVFADQLVAERTQEDPVETCRRLREDHMTDWGPQRPSVACLLPTGIAGDYTESEPCGSIEFVVADKTALVRPLPDMYSS